MLARGILTRWSTVPRWLRRLVAGLVLLISLALALDRCFPLPVRGQGRDFAAVVVASDGTVLRAFPDAKHVWRYPVRLEQVSSVYIDTLLRYEDRGFWWHPGVNPLALVRAAWQWLRTGHVVSGGSTLTMQVARIIEPVPRTLGGKLRQIMRALQLEWHYSKRQILEIYLNYAPMGGVLEGVEAASRCYLGKPAVRLTQADAALLTVLPQSPSRLRIDRFQDQALAARNKVIARMRGHWSEAQINDALMEPVLPLRSVEPLLAPLLAERLHREQPGRALIQSSIDAEIQRTVETMLGDQAPQLPPHVSAAVLVLDNKDLSVRAYAGCADFSDASRAPWVDMVRALRSPGSTLKPFLYGQALDDGLIHSESLLIDAPQSFNGYAPGNFGQAFSGPVSVSEALVRSLNVPAVQVLDQVTPDRFVNRLRQGGVKLTFPKGMAPNLSVVLGGAGTSLEMLVSGYSALARNGNAGQPRFTTDAPRAEHTMLSPGAAYIVRDVLEGGGPTDRAVATRGDRRGVAFKTGTSYGFRDAWTLGVSDDYTVGVWIGRPDGTPNPGFYGANVAAPLLQRIFDILPKRNAIAARARPQSVSQAEICWPDGRFAEQLPGGLCQEKRLAWVLNRTAPPTLHAEHDPGDMREHWWIDPSTGLRVTSGCAGSAAREVEAARWPELLLPWLNGRQRSASEPPPWAAQCESVKPRAREGLRIIGVRSGEVIALTPGQPVPVLRLSVQGGSGNVNWLVNGVLMLSSRPHQAQLLKLSAAGRYEITAIDEEGQFDRVSVLRR